MSLSTFFADLHIHVGQDHYGHPVKITGSKNLTLSNILKESSRFKGMDLVGVIDCHVPSIQEEIEHLIQVGKAVELSDGGIKFESVVLILGTEIELYDYHCHGPIHVLCYFPFLSHMKQFSKWMATRMKNIHLSSQRIYVDAKELQHKVKELNGLFIPAHVFTPFKSLYGKGVRSSLTEVFDKELIDAIELGLSADSKMADQIPELQRYPFMTNSDAHSLPKIGREYQTLSMNDGSFKELAWVVGGRHERKVTANYGMHPQLGKYFSTVCMHCFSDKLSGGACLSCGGKEKIKGVSTRIKELANEGEKIETNRPPYNYHVPLEYFKGIGPKTMTKLFDHFGTEMNIIHHVEADQLSRVIKPSIVKQIMAMRQNALEFKPGGGGLYGRVYEF